MSIATSALAQDVIMRMPTLVIALTSDDINIRYKNANSNYKNANSNYISV